MSDQDQARGAAPATADEVEYFVKEYAHRITDENSVYYSYDRVARRLREALAGYAGQVAAARVAEALRRWGRHDGICACRSGPGGWPDADEARCDCGLFVALHPTPGDGAKLPGLTLEEAGAMVAHVEQRVREMDEADRRANQPPPAICGVVCNCGPNGEPLACGYAAGHAGAHSWASLPTGGGAATEGQG